MQKGAIAYRTNGDQVQPATPLNAIGFERKKSCTAVARAPRRVWPCCTRRAGEPQRPRRFARCRIWPHEERTATEAKSPRRSRRTKPLNPKPD